MLFLEKNTGKENDMIIFVTKNWNYLLKSWNRDMEDGERRWRKVKSIGEKRK